MQASHTLLRLAATACIGMWLAACTPLTGVRPDAGRAAETQAAQYAQRGDHAGAARILEQAAAEAAPDAANRLWIAAAREWVAAGDAAAAERALARVAGIPAAADAREQALVAAEVAILSDRPRRAVEMLDSPGLPEDAALLGIRARALFALGDVPGAVAALVQRDAHLRNPADKLANQRLIVDGVARAATGGADVRPPPGSSPAVAGWLELGRIQADANLSMAGAGGRLQAWRSRYPAHPANAGLWAELVERYSTALEATSQVALLLPLSGRSSDAGVAVRDGFLTAYYEQPRDTRPRVKIYDVAASDAASAYLAALADGAQVVVGPLTREEVANLAAMADGRATTLALNFLPDGTITPSRFYQFALSPEDEARQVARRVVADGRRSGVALVPANEWGQRVLAAFADELARAGGSLVGRSVYAPGTTDFRVIITQLLDVRAVRPAEGQRPGYAYRDDARFIFVAAQPVTGRLIRTQLRFNYASRLPVYSTSDIFDPGSRGSPDLDGVIFPDMPWVIDRSGPASLLRDSMARNWPARAPARSRLYAFGYDAYAIVAELGRRRGPFAAPLPGLTGRLELDALGRILRDLEFVQVRGGEPRVPDTTVDPPSSSP